MSGRDAFGTQFKRGDGQEPESFTTIANVTSISGPSRERESIETTAHDSADQYREFVPGLKDGGEISLDLNYDPTSETIGALDDDFEDQQVRNYQIVILPGTEDEHTWDFAGFLTSLGDEFPHDDKMTRTATVKISGKPTLTATGS